MNKPIIYTCAFRPFSTSGSFWWRDSGLVCRGLQAIGVDAKVILPFRPDEAPDKDVIRASPHDLESDQWWNALGIHAVVFTTWGTEGTRIIQAARNAGLLIVLSTDDDKMNAHIGIIGALMLTWHKLYHLSPVNRAIQTLLRSPVRYHIIESRKRKKQIQYGLADLITCYSPVVWQHARHCSFHSIPVRFGYPANAGSEPTPTASLSSSAPNIIAVAEWIKIKHKRPHFLMDACISLLHMNPSVRIHVFGKTLPFMHERVLKLPQQLAERLIVHGVKPNTEIVEQMSRSLVAICPSAFDGGPVPMAEALCQGCSVVGAGSIVRWASLCGYGEYVISTPDKFAKAIDSELHKWQYGFYGKQNNATFWRRHFCSKNYAERIKNFTVVKLNDTRSAQNLDLAP